MSHINEKLGLKPAGPRAMMKLPTDRALRNRVTRAQCPACGHRGAILSPRRAESLFCPWCAETWDLEHAE